MRAHRAASSQPWQSETRLPSLWAGPWNRARWFIRSIVTASPGSPDSIQIVLAAVRCGERICVAQRSHSVATSRGLWSVVTGYLEADTDPEQQAWTELNEELGLAPPELILRRRLPAVPLTSPTSGKAFLVYPFLFDSRSRRVVLNWEHDAVQWVDPGWLDRPGCVPWQAELVRALLVDP